MAVLQSLIADRWIGKPRRGRARERDRWRDRPPRARRRARFRRSALVRAPCRRPSLLALDFQQRAARLKALAAYLNERKEDLYAISRHTGATRSDGWVDIEGGTGTLYAYASMGGNELPSGNRAARRAAGRARQEGAVRRRPTSWCRAAASPSTSTPSTFRSGGCSRSSRRPFSPACRASPSRRRRRATSPKRWCG